MKKTSFFLSLFFVLFVAFSCKKENPAPQQTPTVTEEPEEQITYPLNGFHGPNILNENVDTLYNPSSMRALIPSGKRLRFSLRLLEGNPWGYSSNSVSGMNVSPYDYSTNTQVFEALQGIQEIDVNIKSNWNGQLAAGKAEINIYENNATTPTRTKIIVWQQ